jgi:hypothetical protein
MALRVLQRMQYLGYHHLEKQQVPVMYLKFFQLLHEHLSYLERFLVHQYLVVYG